MHVTYETDEETAGSLRLARVFPCWTKPLTSRKLTEALHRQPRLSSTQYVWWSFPVAHVNMMITHPRGGDLPVFIELFARDGATMSFVTEQHAVLRWSSVHFLQVFAGPAVDFLLVGG